MAATGLWPQYPDVSSCLAGVLLRIGYALDLRTAQHEPR